MADLNERLSLADQILANAMIAIVSERVSDAERNRLRLHVIVEILPRVNRAHAFIDPLARAANALIDATYLKGSLAGNARCSAQLTAASAVEKFAEWRLGLALDALGETTDDKRENAA